MLLASVRAQGLQDRAKRREAPAIKKQGQEQILDGDGPQDKGNDPLPLRCSSLSLTLKASKSSHDFS